MRKLWMLVLITTISAGSASAETTAQPDNLSCITDTPQPHLQVRRDCDNAYVPQKPPVEEVYLTPSEIPMIGPHDGGAKSDRPGHHDRPDHDGNGGGAGGPNGVN